MLRKVERSVIASAVQNVVGVKGAVPALGKVLKLTTCDALVIGISQLFGSAASTSEVMLKVTLGIATEIVGHKLIGFPVAMFIPLLSMVNIEEEDPFASIISIIIL